MERQRNTTGRKIIRVKRAISRSTDTDRGTRWKVDGAEQTAAAVANFASILIYCSCSIGAKRLKPCQLYKYVKGTYYAYLLAGELFDMNAFLGNFVILGKEAQRMLNSNHPEVRDIISIKFITINALMYKSRGIWGIGDF